LDIGAYDGKTFSNTLALIERGWNGVLVEPAPEVFVTLMANLKPFVESGKVDLVHAAFKPGDVELIKFYSSNGDAVGTTDERHKEKWKNYANFTPLYVNTINWHLLFQSFPYIFDFVNLDI
jgi:FkbM family methyltransferase